MKNITSHHSHPKFYVSSEIPQESNLYLYDKTKSYVETILIIICFFTTRLWTPQKQELWLYFDLLSMQIVGAQQLFAE